MESEKEKILRLKLAEVFPLLNERQRRIMAAAEARSVGRGGVVMIARITGMSRQTIYRGLSELGDVAEPERTRKSGGGRRKLTETTPDLTRVIESIVDETTRGDPESPLRWTCKSVRNIAEDLARSGYEVSHQTVATILHELDYSLQANRKTSEGQADHPDRDAQFRFISRISRRFMKSDEPVISVDTKKKELVGRYKNNGREWERKGNATDVLSHDFPDPSVPKAIPYGVYDVRHNRGWVNVGMDADTAEFAVESIRQWWKHMGSPLYGRCSKLLICADAGGSNGYRLHLWKYEIQKLADELNLEITVVHYPPGTSKWNKIEHRLFSYISINWRGRPLTDYRTIVDLISATKTRSGLIVKARLDKRKYQKGVKVPKEEMRKLSIRRHKFHGEWNYTIKSRNV